MTLSSKHSIRNSIPGGLWSSTLHLGHVLISWKLSALKSKAQGGGNSPPPPNLNQLFTDRYRIGIRAPCQMLFCQRHQENMKMIFISQGPLTSCCITIIQTRAPQKYPWYIVLYDCERMSMSHGTRARKKVSVASPNLVGPRPMAYMAYWQIRRCLSLK